MLLQKPAADDGVFTEWVIVAPAIKLFFKALTSAGQLPFCTVVVIYYAFEEQNAQYRKPVMRGRNPLKALSCSPSGSEVVVRLEPRPMFYTKQGAWQRARSLFRWRIFRAPTTGP